MSNEFDAAVTATMQPSQGQTARIGFPVAVEAGADSEAKRVSTRIGMDVSAPPPAPKVRNLTDQEQLDEAVKKALETEPGFDRQPGFLSHLIYENTGIDLGGANADYLKRVNTTFAFRAARTLNEMQQKAALSVMSAQDVSPDTYAEARRLGERLGIPTITALNMGAEARKQAAVQLVQFVTDGNPAVAKLLANQDIANIASDDIETLGTAERVARQFFGSAAENVGRSLHGFGELLNVAQRRTLLGFSNLFLPTPRAGGKPTDESIVGPLLGDDLKDIGKTTMEYWRGFMVPANKQTFGDQVVGGLGQVGSQILMLPIDRGASLWAQGASIVSEKIEKDDAPQWKKDLAILGGSAVTGITEKYALDRILEPMAVPIKNQIAASLARIGIAGAAEGGQEFTENIGHDLLQKYLTNPDTKVDFGQAGQEGAVGFTVGGIVRSVIEAGLHVKLRGERRAQEANQAEQNAQALQALAEVSQASKLRQRDPEAFAQIIREATEGGAIPDVFISAQTLAQSPNVQKIAAVSPAVAEQLPQALETGGDVRIPVAEFAAQIAGNGYAQDIINDLKTQPGGMTRAEAQAFAHEQAKGVNEQELATLAQEQIRDLTHADEVRQIERHIVEQLDKAGRFSPAVNRAYAALPTAFFDTMAERLGVQPAALWEAYGARIAAEGITGPMLSQDERGGFVPREFTQDEKAVVGLFKNADLSTFLHESGHWFLESYADMAKAAPELQADMQTLLDWFGVKDLDTWHGMSLEEKRAGHERFAQGFESYLHEGKAPSLGLQGLFARFRAWLARVYGSIKGQGVELSDEVRAVLDRMLATQAHIDEAHRARAMAPLFTTAEDAAAHGIDWQQYQVLGREATSEALASMEARSLRDMTWTAKLREETVKRLSRDAAEKRKEIRREVEAEVAKEPTYAAMRWLKRGEMTTQEGEAIKADVGHRLSIPALHEMYPAGALDAVAWEKLGYGKYGMLAEEGLHPDLVAEMFGFQSGDAMVRQLLDAEKFRDVVEATTDQRMLERYGELSTPEAIAKAADEAIHNDVRGRFIATELAGLQKAVGGAQALAKMAKDYAARMIENQKVGGLRPTQYAAAEVRAGKAAEAALKKGDIEEAVKQKRFQLIQHAATRAAYEAQAEMQSTVAAFKAIADAKPSQLQTRNIDLVNAARAILAEFGVGMRGKNPRAYMDAVKAYDPELFATLEPMLQDAEQGAKPLADLTVGELRALRDDIESLWYLARRERQVEVDGKLIDRQQIAQELTGRLEELGVPDEVPGEGKAVTEGEKRVRYLMGLRAALRRVESWADRMDGGNITGGFRRFIFQPISEAAERYRADAGAYLKRYRDLLKAIEPTLKPGRIAAPELGYTFGFSKGDAGKAELLHAILHTGNESNKRKLLLGRGWVIPP